MFAVPLRLAASALVVLAGSLVTPRSIRAADAAFPVAVQVDAGQSLGDLPPIWRFFGADEPNYAYLPHGKKLLGELGELAPRQVYFRTHNLLTSGDGTPALKWGSTGVYREDAAGRPVYDWTILDRIFDTYRDCQVRPYAQIGFMPRDLSIHPEPYQHQWNPALGYNEIYTGWTYPPKDHNKWRELVYQWARHCVERYGPAEVATWYWEVWNEANIGYWKGSPAEFRQLHDYAIDGLKRALPQARVGGPDCAGSGGRFTRDFIDHCLSGTNYATGKTGTPIDFISFHAKGAPIHLSNHVRMGLSAQLKTIEDGFRLVASYPGLKGKPIVIGESDPEGCAACQGPQLAYRNGTLYSSYTAASFARKHELAARHGVNLEGALTWAFEFENQPYFAGFRSLASRGLDKPVLNVFRMFARMRGQRLAASSSGAIALDEILQHGVRERPDVGALASLNTNSAAVMIWHYHDDDVAGPDAEVTLRISNLFPAGAGSRPENPTANRRVRLDHFRIDENHSNAFSLWKKLGSPQTPDPAAYAQLERAGQLARLEPASELRVAAASVDFKFTLPRQAVSLVQLTW